MEILNSFILVNIESNTPDWKHCYKDFDRCNQVAEELGANFTVEPVMMHVSKSK